MNYASSILGLLPGGRRAPGIGQLISKIEAYLPPDQVERVREAFEYAEAAHQGQKRKSGEAFITHPVDLVGREVGFDLRRELADAGSASSARQEPEDGRRVVHPAGRPGFSLRGPAAVRGSRRRGRADSQESSPAPAPDPARRAGRS